MTTTMTTTTTSAQATTTMTSAAKTTTTPVSMPTKPVSPMGIPEGPGRGPPEPDSADGLFDVSVGSSRDGSARLGGGSTPRSEPSLSLLYPDTAPRSAWRPQVAAWIKKTDPLLLRSVRAWVEGSGDEERTVNTGNSNGSSGGSSSVAVHAGMKRRHSSLGTPNYITDSVGATIPAGHGAGATIGGVPSVTTPIDEMPPSLVMGASTSSVASVPRTTAMNGRGIVSLPSPPSSPSGMDDYGTPSASSNASKRRCISCGNDNSPCWRPSWSPSAGQLCNSCGLRYKKTNARCVSKSCGRIPAKGEWATMKNLAVRVNGKMCYSCLACGGHVEVGERNSSA